MIRKCLAALSLVFGVWTHAIASDSSVSFFREVENPFTGDALRTEDEVEFFSFLARETTEKIGKKYGVVYESVPRVFGERISFAVQSTEFLRQYEIELSSAEDPELKKQLLIKPSPVITDWKVLTWVVPDELQEIPLVVRVTNVRAIHDESHFGISSPFVTKGFGYAWQWTPLLKNLILAVFSTVVLLLPGMMLLVIFPLKKGSALLTFPMLMVCTAIIAYLLFWSYFLSGKFGVTISLSCVLLPVLMLGASSKTRSRFWSLFSDRDFLNPLFLLLSSYVIVTTAGFLYGGWTDPSLTAQVRYLQTSMPGDNTLPFVFSERLFLSQPLTPFYFGWLSSDRPPLQAGFVLFTRVFAFDSEVQYHVTSVLLQCLSAPAIYVLVRSGKLVSRASFFIGLTVVFSSSFLLNGFYVWPKLLPAAFMLLNTAFVFNAKQIFGEDNSLLQSLCMGICTTVAMLSHGGSLIGLVPMYAVAFLFRKLPPMRYWIWVILPFVIGMVPWMIYQKYFDPPGNRLVLWHIGGFYEKTFDGTLGIIIDQYRELGLQNWISYKWRNWGSIVGNWNQAFIHLFPMQVSNSFYFLRSGMFLSAALSLFPQLLMAPICIGAILFQKGRSAIADHWLEFLIFVLGIGFWILLIFGPARTILHHGTYYLPFLFMASLLSVLFKVNRPLADVFVILNWILVSAIWVFPTLSVDFQKSWISNIDYYNVPNLMLYLCVSFVFLYFVVLDVFRCTSVSALEQDAE